jgi:hypothetical protein
MIDYKNANQVYQYQFGFTINILNHNIIVSKKVKWEDQKVVIHKTMIC